MSNQNKLKNNIYVKQKSYANRGMTFESMINISNEQYFNKGIACMQKIPTEIIPIRDKTGKVCNVKICGKSTVDYVGRFLEIPVAVEAKSTKKNRIPLNVVKENQRDFLDKWVKNNEGMGYVFVSFQDTEFYLIPWYAWKGSIIARKLKVKGKSDGKEIVPKELCYGINFETTGMASLHKDELPKEWEVKPNQNGILLPYLDNLKIY